VAESGRFEIGLGGTTSWITSKETSATRVERDEELQGYRHVRQNEMDEEFLEFDTAPAAKRMEVFGRDVCAMA
jgi:hypothetical protein